MSHPAVVFFARLFDTGWRRAFPWAALTIVIWAYARNIVIPNSIDLTPYAVLAGFVTTTFITRGAIDKGGLAQIISAVRSPAAG